MRTIYILVLILSVIAACKSQKNSKDTEDTQLKASQGLTLLMNDNYGGAETEEIQVIRSQGALEKYFIKINKTRKPGIKPPSIDFGENMAIVYCPGKTRLATPPELYTSEDSEKGITITPRRVETSENQESSAVLMPFGLYIMPLTDKEIVLNTDTRS